MVSYKNWLSWILAGFVFGGVGLDSFNGMQGCLCRYMASVAVGGRNNLNNRRSGIWELHRQLHLMKIVNSVLLAKHLFVGRSLHVNVL